ncbi:hypothetical protein O5D80_002431 [Batrachochytrium dendrobatidis]|nr:hypothetical protein O5D80_002431 [Batrachochytrium dendrobatidis]
MDGGMLDETRLKLPTTLRRNQPLPGNSNRNIRNACSKCGRDSHFVSNCFSRTNSNGEGLESSDSEPESSLSDACFHCGRDTHFARDCYARTDINGFSL